MWKLMRAGLAVMFLTACTAAPQQPQPGQPLAACGSFPNCVNSYASEGGSAVEPLMALPSQWRALIDQLRDTDNWSITLEQDNFVQAVVTTPLMRYRDDVQLQYLPDTQRIHVRSSSRLGYSDMGANRARVEQLRQWLGAL